MNVSEAPPTPYTRTQHVLFQQRVSVPSPVLGWQVFAAASATFANWLHLPLETWIWHGFRETPLLLFQGLLLSLSLADFSSASWEFLRDKIGSPSLHSMYICTSLLISAILQVSIPQTCHNSQSTRSSLSTFWSQIHSLLTFCHLS